MLRRLKSFQRGTAGLCSSTGCKVTSFQTWRMILSYRNRIGKNCLHHTLNEFVSNCLLAFYLQFLQKTLQLKIPSMDGEMSAMDGVMSIMDGEMSSMDGSVIRGCHPWMTLPSMDAIDGWHPWMKMTDDRHGRSIKICQFEMFNFSLYCSFFYVNKFALGHDQFTLLQGNMEK